MARNDQSRRQEKFSALKKAIEEAGGPAEVARFITENYETITVQAVMDWKVCPPLRAKQLASAAKARGGKTSVRELCPDFAEVFSRAA